MAFRAAVVARRLKRYMLLLQAIVFAVLLSACVSAPQSVDLLTQTAPELATPVLLSEVPFFAQELYQCGPASLAMLLGASGVGITPGQLMPLVYVPGRKGSFQVEMVATTRSLGRISYRIAPTLEALLTEVVAGHPVLVLQNLALAWYPRWHFAVVKGFDLPGRRIILNSGTNESHSVSLALFERTWARSGYWGILALEPGKLPAKSDPAGYFSALADFGRSNEHAQVARAYVSGLQRWPEDRNLLMGYGNKLYSEKALIAAERQFRKLVASYPDYAPAHNNLAQVLHDLGREDEAILHSRRAVELGGEYREVYQSTLQSIEQSMQ